MNVREFINVVSAELVEGGPGSGHWGHRGIPGQRGGSLPGSFSVKDAPSWRAVAYLQMLPKNILSDAEEAIADLQRMAKGPWMSEGGSQAVREAISIYRYTQAVIKKQIAVTPRIARKMNLVNSGADPEAAEGNQALLNKDFDMRSRGHDSWAVLKNEICERLSERSGLSYDEINLRLRQWAETSNDTSAKSLAMQEAAQQEFGSKLSPWQKNQWECSGAGKLTSAEEMMMNRRFLRAMHEETQEHLRSLGVPADGFVTLYRGAKLQSKGNREEMVAYEGNAIESWSTDRNVAASFAGNRQVIEANIPASRIISTATTGFGCLGESEVVVLGGLGPLESKVEWGGLESLWG